MGTTQDEKNVLLSPDTYYEDPEASPQAQSLDVGTRTLVVNHSRRRSWRLSHVTCLRWIFFAQSIALLALLVILNSWRARQPSIELSPSGACGQLSYSPAQDQIEYKLQQFTSVEDVFGSVYAGDPSDEVDQAWSDLYNDIGISQISWEEARDIPWLDESVVFPGDPPTYAVTLSVFHQLHCLNLIRKVVHADYYADLWSEHKAGTKRNIPHHVGHCIDMLRQAVMCAADISPIVWVWSEYDPNHAIPIMNISHTCRDWDKIASWGKEHQLKDEIKSLRHANATRELSETGLY